MKKMNVSKFDIEYNLIKILFILFVIVFFTLVLFMDKFNITFLIVLLSILSIIWVGLIIYLIIRHFIKKNRMGDEYGD